MLFYFFAGMLTGMLDYGVDMDENPVAYFLIPIVAYVEIMVPIIALDIYGVI